MTTTSVYGSSFSEAIAHISRLLRRAVVRAATLDVAVTEGAPAWPMNPRRVGRDLSIALTDLASLLRELRAARPASRSQMNGGSAKGGLVIGRDGAVRRTAVWERRLRGKGHECITDTSTACRLRAVPLTDALLHILDEHGRLRGVVLFGDDVRPAGRLRRHSGELAISGERP